MARKDGRTEAQHPGRVVGWLPAEESDYYPDGDDLPPQVLNPTPYTLHPTP